jgi:hypothetical protein
MIFERARIAHESPGSLAAHLIGLGFDAPVSGCRSDALRLFRPNIREQSYAYDKQFHRGQMLTMSGVTIRRIANDILGTSNIYIV